MSSLKDLFQSALAARSPSPAEANADFQRVLAGARRRRQIRVLAFAAVMTVSAVVGVQIVRNREAAPPGPAPVAASDHSIRIYVKRADEPESAAVSLTVDARGDL